MRSFLRLAGVVVVGLIAGTPSAAWALTLTDQARHPVQRIIIQHNGRHKPFDSFAWETLQTITGKSRMAGQMPIDTVLSIMAEPERWQGAPLVSVPFMPLRQALGMDPKATHISYNDLVSTRKLMRMLPAIVQKEQRDEKLSMLEQETMDAFQRFVALSGLFEHRLELVPPPTASAPSWEPILKPEGYPPATQDALRTTWNAFITSLREADSRAVAQASRHLTQQLRALNPAAQPAAWRVELEVFYNHAHPFAIARWLYLAALLGLLWSLTTHARAAARLGFAALSFAYLLHAAGIAMRVLIGGRPPVSNFFETMLWLPFVAVTASWIFERIYRARYFSVAASLLAAIMLWLSDVVPLDSSISPVVAVLHNNMWLTIHVLTIVASYGAIALAVGLAHIYAWLYLRQSRNRKAFDGLDTFLYRALQVGVVLLASGIMLGAVWANASWGRYWGWDPKETWALITLLWYLALLHGRFAGWLTGIWVALAAIGGFFLLLMTYYGVSFYLVGLHSYAGGHAKPLPPLLIGYGIAELAFLAWVGTIACSRRPRSP